MQQKMQKRIQRFSISVSARTYDRLRSVVRGSVAGFVDGLMASTLDDPQRSARVVEACQPRREADH